MLTKQQICKIVRLAQTTTLSNRGIANVMKCSHQSVGRYKALSSKTKLTWRQMENLSESVLLSKLFPTMPSRGTSKNTPDYNQVHDTLMKQKKQTIFNCWLEYVAGVREGLGKTMFYQGYRHYRKAQKLSMKIEHRAGEIIYIDYAGTVVPYHCRQSNKSKLAQIFVACLGCSQKIFMWATARQTTFDWVEAQMEMLEFYGGVPEIIVTDNPKSLVTRSTPEKVLNANYDNFGQHYQVVIMPGRPRHPQDKGLVEEVVGFITNRVLADMKNMSFFSLKEINQYLLVEVDKLNNLRFQKRDTTRNILFEQYDKPKLRPLPEQRFEIIEQLFKVKVPADYGITVDEHYYSVPYRYAHKEVEVQVTQQSIKILHVMQVIALHQRQREPGGMSRLTAHMHPDHRWFDDKTVDFYTDWSSQFGTATAQLMSLQFSSEHAKSHLANVACRKIQSSYKAEKMTSQEFETACQFALDYQQTTPTHLRHILSSKVYLDAAAPTQAPLMEHDNVRGSDYYSNDTAGEKS